jgi:CRP/FNR family transcriptional regulator
MMGTDIDLLIAHGATSKKYKKGESIFEEGNLPNYFYQILQGEVLVYCTNTEGKELIHGIFKSGDSFGEPPLFLDYVYPSSAKAQSDCVVLRILKEKFMPLLDEHPSIFKRLLIVFASRIYNKTILSQILLCHTPEQKILMFLNRHKEINGIKEKTLIPYTRQQIADITGLRVETVIRTLRKLDDAKKVEIINHKLHY